jgi:hypothetical protein
MGALVDSIGVEPEMSARAAPVDILNSIGTLDRGAVIG